jgi:D-alanine-D-alanine ligase
MRILVLMGGTSTERDVSLASGSFVARSLQEAGHDVAVLDVPGDVGREPHFVAAADRGGPVGVAVVPPSLEELRALEEALGGERLVSGIVEAAAQADVTFIGLHGGFGEDGHLQAVLETARIVHTGADYLGCALAFNKPVAKALMRAAGILTPDWQVVRPDDEVPTHGTFPVIVKPTRGGSTIGLSLPRDPAAFDHAVRGTLAYGDVLIEEFIAGREFTVGVVGGEPLPVIEIEMPGQTFDYEAKYQPGGAREICPAPIPEDQAVELQALAAQVHETLHIGDHAYSRVDFRVDADGRAYCLEANVLPGMTPNSLLPLAVRTSGAKFTDFCERLIDLALERGR